ncbi:MAG: hypothetical protein LBQ52_00255 [Helicobacteraceae bacterium]|jgi:tetratricopeptide (TPR) repeat protein|nr:hypothetical protein [Helicobacteraceae bacterium]
MTRQERKEANKRAKEKDKAFDEALKTVGKTLGFKSILAIPYKFIDDFVYETHISANLIDANLLATVYFKPLILDRVYWEAMGISETAQKQPKSFHVKGAFSANTMYVCHFDCGAYEKIEDAERLASEILNEAQKRIDLFREEVYDLPTFAQYLSKQNKPYLKNNKILTFIALGEYEKAIALADEAIKNDKAGLGAGFWTIVEYARAYANSLVSRKS